jgi:hypothetical protein
VVWETEEGWGIRADLAIVEAKVWEIEVLAWVTVEVRGRELELAQAIVEGAVAVGEGVPSKAPVAEAVMCVAPAPAVPQAVAGEVVATEVVAVVGVAGVVVVAGGDGSGCLYLCQVDWIFAVGGKEDASSNRKLGKSLDE